MKIFSAELCELAEAPLWHSGRDSLFWLDIVQRRLFEKNMQASAAEPARAWQLPEYTSAMALDSEKANIIWMVTDRSFGHFNLDTGHYQATIALILKNGQRSNDGSVSPAGDFYFGSMAWQPEVCDGEIYSISRAGELVNHGLQWGIPNTFCWGLGGHKVLISDSLQGKIFSFKLNHGIIDADTKTLFTDPEADNSCPDGGAMDVDGCIWIAQWDGSRVVKYDRNGTKKAEILLPVPRPTACCFGGKNGQQIFITTARVDMNQNEQKQFPQSGQVFIVDTGVQGAPVFPFRLDT